MTITELKTRKKQLGWTNETLAKQAGIPLSTVAKILSGATKNPRQDSVLAMEKAIRKGESDERITKETSEPAPFQDTASGTQSPVMRTGYATVAAVHTATPYQPLSEGILSGKDKEAVVAEDRAQYNASYNSGTSARKMVEKYDRQGTYTLKDYLALPDDQRAELIDGVIYDMSAPYTVHQAICVILTHLFMNFIDSTDGPCLVLSSPVDVQLDKDDRTIVEPDICILCDREKLHAERIYGAPDFVVEILSPSTKRKDMTLKMWKYSNAGVREYWTVDPDKLVITVFDFEHDNGIQTYSFHDKVPVGIYDGKLTIDFEKILTTLQQRYGYKMES